MLSDCAVLSDYAQRLFREQANSPHTFPHQALGGLGGGVGAFGAAGALGTPGAAGALGAPGTPGGFGAPGILGLPGAARPGNSSAPQALHTVSVGPFFSPHSGHTLFISTAAGLKHMVDLLSRFDGNI